jgi:hypothetical protein
MDGEASSPIDELDELDLVLLSLLGEEGTETTTERAYASLLRHGLVEAIPTGVRGVTWIGPTRAGLRRLRRRAR